MTPAFRPLIATAEDFADLNYHPDPEVVRITTCRVVECMTWARLRAEDITNPAIEDYAKQAWRNNPIPPPEIQRELRRKHLDEAIRCVDRAIRCRGEA